MIDLDVLGQGRLPFAVVAGLDRLPRGRPLVVAARGEADLHTADQLHHQLTQVLDCGARGVVLGLGGLTFCDSSGFAVLYAVQDRPVEIGVELTVSGMSPQLSLVDHVLRPGVGLLSRRGPDSSGGGWDAPAVTTR